MQEAGVWQKTLNSLDSDFLRLNLSTFLNEILCLILYNTLILSKQTNQIYIIF